MSRAIIPLPSFKTMEAALRKTTEFLARELAHPGKQPPQWNDLEWRIAQAVAALHGISALLSKTLLWTGPREWQDFLAEQARHTALRQQRITELLDRIDSCAWEHRIAIVALKGAALLDTGIYRAGERPMGDIDLLIDSEDVDACTQVLQAVGYVASFVTWRHRIFVPERAPDAVGFGEHVDNPIKIELHERISERLPFYETDITALELPPYPHPGLNPYPSAAALMRHLLLHAAGNMRARALRLIQLYDIALLADRMSSTDWQEFFSTGRAERGLWWAFPPLVLTARYYPAVIRPSLIEAIAPDCPWWLRRVAQRHRLADVSWSKIRIQAFPGIEWSKSLQEAMLFGMSRVWPNRRSLAELGDFVVAQPSMSRIPWYGLSHGARILRWVFSRPPRVQTIFSVRSALGHDLNSTPTVTRNTTHSTSAQPGIHC